MIRCLLAAALLAPRPAAAGRMAPEEAAKKTEGTFVTGLPLTAYSTDTGLGYGALVLLTADGSRADPRFATDPYASQLGLQYFATTGGWQYHMVDWDAPDPFGLPFRIRAELVYERDTDRNFFGLGTGSLAAVPGGMAAYQRLLDAREPGGPGTTDAAFHRYDLERPKANLQLERSALGLVGMLGAQFARTTVRVFDGRTVRVDGVDRTQGPTWLTLARPVGFTGGWLNHLRAGLARDTRDFEPDPRAGSYHDAVVEWAGPAIGSDYTYSRETLTVRAFTSPLARLTLAGRGSYAVTQGQPPFFDLGTMGWMDARAEGLGGGWSLRGYRQNRFTGRASGLLDGEARWRAGERVWGSQRFALIVVGFADGGRVYDSGRRLTLRNFKADAGGGIRIAWNLSTIVNATYGRSAEDANVFINFGHQF